jgi:hypothetical protein
MQVDTMPIYVLEVLFQCEAAELAAKQINDALTAFSKDIDNPKLVNPVLIGVQAFLNSCACLSRVLWGTKKETLEDRHLLRQTLAVTDTSALRDRNVRNCLGHIDNAFDHWALKKSSQRTFFLGIVGKRRQEILTDKPIKYNDENVFRYYDPNDSTMFFGKDSASLQALSNEINGLSERAATYMQFFDIYRHDVR